MVQLQGLTECSTDGGAYLPGYNNNYFNWTDPTGAVHEFPGFTQQPISGFCPGGVISPPNNPSMTGYAADGSGYYISVISYTDATIFDSNGNEVYPVLTDRNGNYFSNDSNGNLIDTLGRTPVVVTPNGSQTFYDVLTVGGTTKRYTVTTETINVNTAFGQSGVNEYSGNLTAIQSITLPDGSSYTFNYDSGTSSGNYGELQSITLPTGGTVSFAYDNYLDSYQNENRWLSSYTGGNGSYAFSPSVVTQCSGPSEVGCQEKITVTDGNGNEVAYLLTLNNGAWNTQMDFNNGSSSHIMSTATGYSFSTSCQTYNCSGSQWINASSVSTWLSDTNQVAQTQYTYANPAIAKPSRVQMWDYYSGNLTTPPPGGAAKELDYTYGYSVNGAAFATQINMLDSSGTLVAQTINNYDQGSVTSTSGLPNHGAAPGFRGNITSVITGIGAVTSSSTYDDAGTKLSDTDGRNYTTSYTSMCSDAYVQTVTYPISVSAHGLQSTSVYDCSSGNVTSTQNMNDVVNGRATSYTYFTSGSNVSRIEVVSHPDGGSTTYSYPSPTETDASAAQTASVTVVSKTILDEFGRPYQTVKVAPEGVISSETSYDGTGRPSCVTTAHLQGTQSGTDGSTCTTYDVLGRITTTTMPDGNAISSTYSGPIQTITDELGHSKQFTYDAFHRLRVVMEPNSSGSLTNETDYSYTALDKVKQVDQWGGPNGSSSPGDRKRIFAYNNLGQMIAENIPENQSVSNPASLTCSGTTSGTLWTNCFTPDANGNTVLSTDNANNSISYSYDALNRITKETYPGGSYGYGYDGYDENGNLITASTYNVIGKLSHSSNEVNAASNFYYDAMGRLVQESYCVPQNCSYSISVSAGYDFLGNMTSLTYPDGRVLSQSFDSANRFTGVQYAKWGSTTVGSPYYSISAFAPPGEPTSAAFGNADGITSSFNKRQSINALAMANSSGTFFSKQFNWDRNATNLLLETDTLTGLARQFGYDTLNRVNSAVDVNPNPTTATASVTISGSEQSAYEGNPCQSCAQYGCPPCPEYVYDSGSQSISVNGVSVGSISWSQNSTTSSLASDLAAAINGNSNSPVTATASGSTVYLTSKTSGPTGDYGISVGAASWNTSYFSSPSFTISAPGSLTGGDAGGTPVSGGLNEAYAHDPFGNLTQSGNFSFSQSFTALNQMSSGYNYDAKGEGLNDIFGDALSYDANGMLTSVANGAETYVYDAQSNRVEVHGSTVTDFIYFNGRPIAMLNGGSYTDLIYAGKSLIAEVAGTQNSAPTYRALDDLGTLQGDAQSSGSLAGAVNYAPYGQIFTGSTSDPFQFASLEWDSTSAMYHAGYRQFSPQQGRWMTADPYNGSYDLEDPQSLNRYSYVRGNPLLNTDSTGLVDGWATGIGGSPCSAVNLLSDTAILAPGGFNDCTPVASFLTFAFSPFLIPLADDINNGLNAALGTSFSTSVNAGQIVPYMSAAITIFCSIHNDSDACGTSITSLIPGNWGKAVGDTIAVATAVWGAPACAAGGISDPVCDAFLIYNIANAIYGLFGRSKFHGSLKPRPSALSQSDLLNTLGVPINGKNLDIQSHHSSKVIVPSPIPLGLTNSLK
jgi:RHS repeat-associated protein